MNKFRMSNKLKRLVSSKVPYTFDGTSLIDYLCQRYKYQSREIWLGLIDAGDLKINSQIALADQLLKSNDLLEYDYTPDDEPIVDRNFEVLFEDDLLMVINKPGDLPMHPSGKFFNNTLWALLKPKYGKIYFINRLDRETSGLVLLAKDPKTAAQLAGQFERREVDKEYIVIVEGSFDKEIQARGFLRKDEFSCVRKKLVFETHENYKEYGKDGVFSEFLPVSQNGSFSLVKVKIHTGKMHQIRATIYSLGFPVVGDKIYGVDDSFFEKFIAKTLTEDDKQKMILKRQALHAEKLSFKHPESSELVSFTAPLPQDMQELI